MSIQVWTEMPAGEWVDVCGIKYTQKKNIPFRGSQQFSFFSRWKKSRRCERGEKSL